MRRTVVAVVLVLALGGCGGGGGDQAELERAVRAYSAAFLGGRAQEAHEMLSARCKDRLLIEIMAEAATAAKAAFGSARITTIDVVDLQDTLARVTYRYDVPAVDQEAEPWTKEGGRWRQDDC